ncbi:MAG: hypothetical protein QG582_62 [Candidatus Thermoplasmatota archaeon]|nr:hypothetical protein [Candidatus Thermoplasmatota archaeon]
MHKANLVAITEVRNVPPDIRPFVSFMAEVEGRGLSEDELVAVLVIDTTTSYIPVFLKDPPTMASLEETLARQDATLTSEAKAALARHVK